MKRNTLAVAAIAFAATTSAIGTAVAAFTPNVLAVAVSVRRDEATSGNLVSAGTQSITPVTSGTDLTVQVDDKRTPAGPIDTRKGRDASDVIIQTASATTITLAQSGVVIQ